MQIVYNPEPTPKRFHQDDVNFFKYIEGPFGSGKSSACVMELLMRAFEQQPDDDGYRKSRWAIIRNDYPKLKSTTIKTFQMWIPERVAPIVYSTPIEAKMRQKLADGTVAEIEFVFIALDRAEDVDKLTSLELTGAYINEAREIDLAIFETLRGRVNRYPRTVKDDNDKVLFGPTRPGIIADSNPPRTTHWLFEYFQKGAIPEGFAIYVQPPAVYKDPDSGEWVLNPDAENLRNLPDGYYAQQLSGATDDHVGVNLGGEYGMTKKGKPVYNKFVRSKHVAKEVLKPDRFFPIVVGLDFGLQPAAAFTQQTHTGFKILREIPMTDESLEDFISEYLRPIVNTEYIGHKIILVGDPSGMNRSDMSREKLNRFNVLRQAGFTAYPAISNNIITRTDAVNYYLSREGALIVSPNCTMIIEGFAGGYIWKEARNNAGGVVDKPDKNEYSHPHDAVQYAALFHRKGAGRFSKPATEQAAPAKHLYA